MTEGHKITNRIFWKLFTNEEIKYIKSIKRKETQNITSISNFSVQATCLSMCLCKYSIAIISGININCNNLCSDNGTKKSNYIIGK